MEKDILFTTLSKEKLPNREYEIVGNVYLCSQFYNEYNEPYQSRLFKVEQKLNFSYIPLSTDFLNITKPWNITDKEGYRWSEDEKMLILILI